ncbi:MAG: DHH family phosphoesterase [Candidatus Micrarchaeota archaeon]|nr:DHH family phosphoesterase [Candidatus Micrarchaeota archaeon]
MPDIGGFLNKCNFARQRILTFTNPLIIHHYDCDGISSGAIVSTFLTENNIHHDLICTKKLDEHFFDKLKQRSDFNKREYIFTDLGSSSEFLNQLDKVVIIDHHQRMVDFDNHVTYVNAMSYGFDGSHDMSASTTAYFVCQTAIELGILGAIGDMQYPFERGLNKEMIEIAKKEGRIEVNEDLVLFGKSIRNLVELLTFSVEPYLPGLSNDYQLSKKLVADCNLDPNLTYYDLTFEQKKIFVSAIVKFLIERNYHNIANKLVSVVYRFPKFKHMKYLYDANDFSSIVNACGRNSRCDLAIDLCKLKVERVNEAEQVMEKHRKLISESIQYALSNYISFDFFYLIDGRNKIPESIIGIVCSMLGLRDKPVIGLAYDENNNIKVSGRATKELVESGLNLGELMSESSKLFGKNGGGHKIAAGAVIYEKNLNQFLLYCNNTIKKQLSIK